MYMQASDVQNVINEKQFLLVVCVCICIVYIKIQELCY